MGEHTEDHYQHNSYDGRPGDWQARLVSKHWMGKFAVLVELEDNLAVLGIDMLLLLALAIADTSHLLVLIY